MRITFLLVALIVLSGCDTVSTTSVSSTGSKRGLSADGVARYAFHRNTPLSEVTKELPAGTVDYVDLDMADQPNVLVVVTASARPRDGLTFKTAFFGDDNLKIEKRWTPATREGDDEHVGIFVLPSSIEMGRTSHSRRAKKTSLDDTSIIF